MNYQDLIGQLLHKRGYITPDEQVRFLQPNYDAHTHNPFLMPDMGKGIARVFSAILNDEHICVYSDYDADGIPGAVVLHDLFAKIGYKNVSFYVPHRHNEGYGLHRDALAVIATRGTKLLISVDLGITAHDEVIYAKELGIEVIVTDHHEPLATLPDCYALINPKVPRKLSDGSEVLYPDTMLCGCAVAFKFAQGILGTLYVAKKLLLDEGLNDHENLILETIIDQSDIDTFASRESITAISEPLLEKLSVPPAGWDKWLLDMVGIATLSDMVPLVNENRVLAYYGMQVIKKTRRAGLLALFRVMRIYPEQLAEDDIVFSITPRLNAASRMAHPEVAFNLLTTTDPNEARSIADELSKLNDLRKREVATAMKLVHKKLASRESLPTILVIGDSSWTPGILGLIASKIVEEYDRTVFVWCIEGDSVKGSARARNGDHVVDLMKAIEGEFTQYGGHEGAGGFSTDKDRIHFLEEKLNAACDALPTVDYPAANPEHAPDFTIALHDVSRDLHTALQSLAPYGLGNRRPLFAWQNIQAVKADPFGKGMEHLSITFSANGKPMRAIKFFAKPEHYSTTYEDLLTVPIDLYGEVEYSIFMGKGELRIKIVDIKKANL